MRMLKPLVLVTVMQLALTPTPAVAQTVYYDDASLFYAATKNHVVSDFEGIAAPGSFAVIAGIGGVGLSSASGSSLLVVDPGSDIGYDWGTGAVFAPQHSTPTNSVTFSFGAPVTAFGISFGALGRTNVLFTFMLSGGESIIRHTTGLRPNFDFFAVTSGTGFTTLTISSGANPMILDDMIVAESLQQVVPEPISLILLSTGLAGVAARRRRRG